MMLLKRTVLGLFVLSLLSCLSLDERAARLTPPKPTSVFRLDDIKSAVRDDPTLAIHLIGAYESRYAAEIVPETQGQLNAFYMEAVEQLKTAQAMAISEKRWDDAASLARSLASVGVQVEGVGNEPDVLLTGAKQELLDGNNLSAFLAAVRAYAYAPLSAEDVLPFLERAVQVRQRRTAAFFLDIIDKDTSDTVIQVSAEDRAYAEGHDSVSAMIKGVATVLVDRGIRIEHGMGTADWILGSAFFVDDSGLLITNYHVIASEVDPKYEGSSRMYIRMGDASSARIPARVVGWDKAMDLALIKVEIDPEYVFSVIDWIVPDVGDAVRAIGSPLGLEKTVTSGIVSALGRRLLQIGDVIQIDAAVNAGNSGGPLLDPSGRLVGVVFAGIERYQGLNFAIPASRLFDALPAMLKGGKAERPWLGLSLAETSVGAEIIYIAPNTPAAEQGVPENSVIVSVNGKPINASQGMFIPTLQNILYPTRPGELVMLETADGAHHVIRSAARPDVPLVEAAKQDSRERMAAPLFGLVLSSTVDNSLFSAYLVQKVIRGSIADEAGLSVQDPISIRSFHIYEDDGYALMNINVKKRRMGYIETFMQLPAFLDSPDTL
ncbi:MAG: trypsin-like peptidase domain-containing protein [Treponema sp.]|jgi:S1-C subfamily serine protease|nr:trypsin-like peptidase domain-containing protein [Treponema sp.]